MSETIRKPVLYSAVQPSGTLTLGNYIGALRNFKLLEKDYDCLFCMADLHALTVRQEPAALPQRAGLAAGDPICRRYSEDHQVVSGEPGVVGDHHFRRISGLLPPDVRRPLRGDRV